MLSNLQCAITELATSKAHNNMVKAARIELALQRPKRRVMPFHYALKPVYLDKLEKSPRYSDLSVAARSNQPFTRARITGL